MVDLGLNMMSPEFLHENSPLLMNIRREGVVI
jgi:hypothetical protein